MMFPWLPVLMLKIERKVPGQSALPFQGREQELSQNVTTTFKSSHRSSQSCTSKTHLMKHEVKTCPAPPPFQEQVGGTKMTL